MNDGMYHFIIGTLDLILWGGEMTGEANLPRHGPAVLIANHHESLGPIAACCSIPLRLYSWVVADMVDKERAAAYLKWDFVERTLHIPPPMSAWFARGLSNLSVPFLRGLGSIPVYKGEYDRMLETLQISLDILRQGKYVLIFPEESTLPRNPETGMAPFQHSFVRLGEMLYAETGQRLPFYPVVVHPRGVVMVGQPVQFDPLNRPGLERHRLKDLMETTIRSMYLQLENPSGAEAAMLMPEH